MYHGVPHTIAERLRLQGADVRYAGENAGKMFGAGIYLATNASKADIYTTANDAGERCTFIMRACLGEVHETKVAMQTVTRAPERADQKGPLDSVRAIVIADGGAVEHPEFIVYKDNQVLPEYLMTYKHRQSCKCTHCA